MVLLATAHLEQLHERHRALFFFFFNSIYVRCGVLSTLCAQIYLKAGNGPS